jgi:hypothetical protein
MESVPLESTEQSTSDAQTPSINLLLPSHRFAAAFPVMPKASDWHSDR